MLVYALYNSYQFLIVQKLWNNFYLTPFYLFSITIAVLRIDYFFHNFMTYDYQREALTDTWSKVSTCAFIAKTLLSVFQIGSIVDLVISIRISVAKTTAETGCKQMNLTKAVVVFLVVLFSVGGGVYYYTLVHVRAHEKEENHPWIKNFFIWSYPTVLVSLCVGLVTTSVVVIYNMNLYFDKRLREEKVHIELILVVLSIAYLSQAATYLLYRILFEDMNSFRETMIFYVSYLIWDVIPLTLIMQFHGSYINKQDSRI